MILLPQWSVTLSDGDGGMDVLLQIKGDLDAPPWVKAEIRFMDSLPSPELLLSCIINFSCYMVIITITYVTVTQREQMDIFHSTVFLIMEYFFPSVYFTS